MSVDNKGVQALQYHYMHMNRLQQWTVPAMLYGIPGNTQKTQNTYTENNGKHGKHRIPVRKNLEYLYRKHGKLRIPVRKTQKTITLRALSLYSSVDESSDMLKLCQKKKKEKWILVFFLSLTWYMY